MNRNKIIVLYLLLSGIGLLAINCKHEIPGVSIVPGGNGTPTQSSNCSPDSVYFANEVLPLINSNCATAGCHDAITHKEGVELTSYSKIRTYVKPFNGGDSKLYEVIVKTNDDRMPPAPMSPLTAAQKSTILKWINQGAFNNQCTGGCDTSSFTYAATVSVTINTFCKGCHNPASLGGGIDLSTYASTRVQAINGKLAGTISHAAGFIAMPQGGSKLSDCQVSQVKKWIAAGTPNN